MGGKVPTREIGDVLCVVSYRAPVGGLTEFRFLFSVCCTVLKVSNPGHSTDSCDPHVVFVFFWEVVYQMGNLGIPARRRGLRGGVREAGIRALRGNSRNRSPPPSG